MKIHEYQAKELFRQAGVPVLDGIVAKTPDEAVAAYDKLGGKIAVVKSQIHAGGRGKGTIKGNPEQRGVVVCKTAAEVRKAAEGLLGNTLVTIQTGPEGKTVNQVFVEDGCNIARELYLGHRPRSGRRQTRADGQHRRGRRDRESRRRNARTDLQRTLRPRHRSGALSGPQTLQKARHQRSSRQGSRQVHAGCLPFLRRLRLLA